MPITEELPLQQRGNSSARKKCPQRRIQAAHPQAQPGPAKRRCFAAPDVGATFAALHLYAEGRVARAPDQPRRPLALLPGAGRGLHRVHDPLRNRTKAATVSRARSVVSEFVLFAWCGCGRMASYGGA